MPTNTSARWPWKIKWSLNNVSVVSGQDQYCSKQYQALLAKHDLICSMSGKGNCYDNAAIESFFGRYKTSAVRDHVFANEAQVRANVFDYIEVFYNRYILNK